MLVEDNITLIHTHKKNKSKSLQTQHSVLLFNLLFEQIDTLGKELTT